MSSVHGLSIPRKIVAITMIISAAALLMASAALLATEYVAARRDLAADTVTMANIVADEVTAALSFDDRAAAAETLGALSHDSEIVRACIYSGGSLFATHLSGDSTEPCPLSTGGAEHVRDGERADVPVIVKGKQIGSVYLLATLAPAYARLRLEVLTVAAILLLATLFALLLSARLQKWVSAPILNLAAVAKEVSLRKDYSIQAVKQNDDELGTLVDAFNGMLRQIQARELELKDRTAALETANESMLRAARIKDDFLATLSHELRTPLTAVFGWLSLLKAGDADRARVAKAVEVIDRNARAQLQLVDDLLSVSQMVTGKLRIHPTWVPIGPIVQNAIDSIQPAAAAKGIHVVTEIADGVECVFIDKDRLQQVLWNLLTNAMKFSERDGVVQVTCRRIESRLQLTVGDNGQGIDPEFIPFVFERFSQEDPTKTRKHGGLGLAIVRHIVESHGGTVAAQSEGHGRGATFTVLLPIPPNPEQSMPSVQTNVSEQV